CVDDIVYHVLMIMMFWCCSSYLFFFQAEDGIRDDLVTGVQTCALPISLLRKIDFAMLCSNWLVLVRGGRRLNCKFTRCLRWPRRRSGNFGRCRFGGRRPRMLLIPRCQLSIAASLFSISRLGIDFFQRPATNGSLSETPGASM